MRGRSGQGNAAAGGAPGPKREALERASWSWVDEVDDPDRQVTLSHVRRAYRMHFPPHYPVLAKCKRNCRFNPRCYSAMGKSI